MTEIRTQASMEHIIRRLEAIHRALRTAPASFGGDARVTEAVAGCLRQLHAIAAQSAQSFQSAQVDPAREARLRLTGGPSRRLH
jgi:hypothetical protein